MTDVACERDSISTAELFFFRELNLIVKGEGGQPFVRLESLGHHLQMTGWLAFQPAAEL